MPIDFPNSPAVNDTFTGAGKSWNYNGNAWILIGVNPFGVGNSYNLDGGVAASNYGGITSVNGGGAA